MARRSAIVVGGGIGGLATAVALSGRGWQVRVVAIVVAALLPLRARRTFAAAVTVPVAWCAPRTYVITGDGLESSTDLTSSRWSWQAVRRVDERPEAYLFWQDGPAVFDLPREPMTTGQEAELRAYLSGRGLLSQSISTPQ